MTALSRRTPLPPPTPTSTPMPPPMLPPTSPSIVGGFAESVAALAEHSLLSELRTWPKPGLVSDVDTGSHSDMNADTFQRSAAAIGPYFGELVMAGGLDADMATLRRIGLHAERAMLEATRGVNTHRGAIFGLGLLCAAAGLRAAGHADAALSLGSAAAMRWGRAIAAGPRLPGSHGEQVARRHGAGGARQEAMRGFPSVYDVGVPVLIEASTRVGAPQQQDAEAARVQTCFALIAVLEDTNLLHRGGVEGLRFAQAAARGFLDDGGIRQPRWRERARAIHDAFVARRLSPGGSADVLAASVFVRDLDTFTRRP